ncbi:MAG: hypothetical protein KDC26_02280 [Armatimonadetes bacterium]|nr:hypothetical protein [Armatimonadota bacterium]
MAQILPWLFLVLAVICLFLAPNEEPKKDEKKKLNFLSLGIFLGVGLVILFLAQNQKLSAIRFDGVIIGGLLLMLINLWRPSDGAALALAGFALTAPFPHAPYEADIWPFWVMTMGGVAAFATLAMGCRTGAVFAAAAGMGAAANHFMPAFAGPNQSLLPAMLISIGVIGMIVREVINHSGKMKSDLIAPIGGALLVLVSFAFLPKPLEMLNGFILIGAPALIAIIIGYAMKGNSNTKSLPIVASLIWLGLATFAYSEDKSFGMTLAATSAVIASLVMGGSNRLASVAPLMALAVYRVFRDVHTSATRSLDIGQHYALVGILVGIFMVIMLAEWGSQKREGNVRSQTAVVIGTLLSAALTLFAIMFLGSKGGVGLLVGLLVGPALVALIGTGKSIAVASGVGLAGLVGLSYGSLADLFSTERSTKQTAFLIAAGVCVAMFVLLKWLEQPKKEAQNVAA